MNVLHLYYIDSSKRNAVVEMMQRNKINCFFSDKDIALDEIDALFVGADDLNANRLKSYPRLKIIQVIGKSTDLIDLEYCERNKIKVLTSDIPRGHLVAEHSISLALALIRRLVEADSSIRAGLSHENFDMVEASETSGCDNWPSIKTQTLYGSKVGILGLGAIGLELVKRLRPFGCSIYYNKRSSFSVETDKRLGITFLGLEELLSTVDIMFIQMPLTDSTRHLINMDNIKEIKPGLILVNCGRADIFEEEAFLKALDLGLISYAGLDVFWREPLPVGHALCSHERVLLTPHIAESGGDAPGLTRH